MNGLARAAASATVLVLAATANAHEDPEARIDEITQQLTMANLVCACTGVPRRDYEMIYNGG
jgi:hypothetical protein